MLMCRALVAPAAAVAFLTAGCSSVIQIQNPVHTSGPPNLAYYDPVPNVVVYFVPPNFKPAEPWYVDLDGTNLTGLSPAAVPGGTSSQAIGFTSSGTHTVTAQGTCGTFCSYPSDQVTFQPPALVYNSITFYGSNRDLTNHVPTSVFVGVQNFRTVPLNVTIQEVSLST